MVDKTEKKHIKGAPTKLPKKRLLLLIIEVFLLLVATIAVIITSQLFVGNIMIAIIGVEKFVQPVMTAIYSVLSYAVAIFLLVGLPAIYKWTRGDQTSKNKPSNSKKLLKHLGLDGLPTWSDIWLAPLGYVAYLIIAMILTSIFTLFPWFNAGEAQEIGFSVSLQGGERLVAFIILVVVAPIAEEILFRGWLYDKLRHEFHGEMPKWLNVALSIFLTSLTFGVVHLQWNVGVNVFAMSIILCLLRELTGTTYAGILLHMLKNGLAFYLLYVLGM